MDLLMKLAEAQDSLRAAQRRDDTERIRLWKARVSVLERLIERKGL